jgi:hypothetical protein
VELDDLAETVEGKIENAIDSAIAASTEYTDSKTIYIAVTNIDNVFSLSDGWTYESIKEKIEQNYDVILVCDIHNRILYLRYSYYNTVENALYFTVNRGGYTHRDAFEDVSQSFFKNTVFFIVINSDDTVEYGNPYDRIVLFVGSSISNYKLPEGYTYDQIISLIQDGHDVMLAIEYNNNAIHYYRYSGLIKYNNYNYVVPEFAMYYNHAQTKLLRVFPESVYQDGNVIAGSTNLVMSNLTINGKALSSNITLSASDVNAYTKSEIDNLELITVDDIDAICGGAVQVATLSNEVMF